MLAFAAYIILLYLWYYIGRVLTDLLTPKIDNNLRDGLSISIGLACLSFIVALAGCYHFSAMIGYAVFFIPFLFLLFTKKLRFKISLLPLKSIFADFTLPIDKFLWIAIGILAVLDLVNCGNVAVGWDAAVDHYAVPEAFIRANGLVDIPENPFSYYPLLGEMLFAIGLGIYSVWLAGAMSWIFLIPLILGFLSIGRSLGHPRIGLWATLLFLGAPLTFELPFSGVVDLIFFTYCLLALALFLEKNSKMTWGRAVLIGILIGCACATKHLGLLFLAAFVPLLLRKTTSDDKSVGLFLAKRFAIVLAALLIPLLWYIRAYHYTGDPLYPFLSNLINLSGARGNFSIESFARTDYPRSITGFILYLWHMTMDYWDQRPWYLAIHPAWLAMLPPALVWAFKPGSSKDHTIVIVRVIFILAFLTMLINFFLAPAYPRYLFPTWLCLALISAWVLYKIRIAWPIIGKILLPLLLALPFILVLGMAAKRSVEVFPQYFSADAREEALRREVPGYDTFTWANEHTDPDHSLILSIDPKIYYLDSPAIIAKPGIESHLMVPWDSEPEVILANWRELGVTHFILDTTLLSVKHGFGILLFTDILDNRDAVWLDITTTRQAADKLGIGDILTDDEFLYMSKLGGLPVVEDGTYMGRHLFTHEKMEIFQSWGRDWKMADTILKFIDAGILVEKFRSGPGGGIRIYQINLPPADGYPLPDLPDVSMYGLPYEPGSFDQL